MQNALTQMTTVCQSFLNWCYDIISTLMTNDIFLLALAIVLFGFVFHYLWSVFTDILYIICPSYHKWYNSKHNIDDYFGWRDKK